LRFLQSFSHPMNNLPASYKTSVLQPV